MPTISGENAKNIRASMDVLIEIALDEDHTMTITNDNLISCTVSLRSDLSKWGPTLPASEIEIDAFYTSDMSEYVANIPDGTPVIYSAGYPGDMSPERYFYIDEQVTWQDNVLHIHAVDQVNKLDDLDIPPIFFGNDWDGSSGNSHAVFRKLYIMFLNIIEPEYFLTDGARVIDHLTVETEPLEDTTSRINYQGFIFPRRTAREFISVMQNWFRWELTWSRWQISTFWPTYVDAGRPALTWSKPTAKWSISEADVANKKSEVERSEQDYRKYVRKYDAVQASGAKQTPFDSSGTLFHNGGIATDYEEFTTFATFGLRYEDNDESVFDVVPGGNTGYDIDRCLPRRDEMTDSAEWYEANAYGKYLLDESPEKNSLDPSKTYQWINLTWNTALINLWNSWKTNGQIDSDAESTELESNCRYYRLSKGERSTTGSVQTESIDLPFALGSTIIYPDDEAYSGLFLKQEDLAYCVIKRSNKKGSFTWKGDPRMQPRDVFTLQRLDYALMNEDEEAITDESGNELYGGGAADVCTIESITLQHSGGGLSAEITYRMGIC